MEGREGLTGGSKCPRCKAVSQPVCEALQSRCPCRDRAGKYWRREPQVDGMKDGGGGGTSSAKWEKAFHSRMCEQDGGQEGRDIPRGKEEGFAFTKKKKRWRFSFVFYNKKGAEILKLRA